MTASIPSANSRAVANAVQRSELRRPPAPTRSQGTHLHKDRRPQAWHREDAVLCCRRSGRRAGMGACRWGSHQRAMGGDWSSGLGGPGQRRPRRAAARQAYQSRSRLRPRPDRAARASAAPREVKPGWPGTASAMAASGPGFAPPGFKARASRASAGGEGESRGKGASDQRANPLRIGMPPTPEPRPRARPARAMTAAHPP